LYRIHNLEAQGAARIAELFRDGLLRGLAARFLGTRTHSTVCARWW
jgi:hypothetical protein